MRRKTVKIVSDLEDTQRTLPSDDHAGKVFVALGHGIRRCLICDGVFTRQGAAQHLLELCSASHPVSSSRQTSLK